MNFHVGNTDSEIISRHHAINEGVKHDFLQQCDSFDDHFVSSMDQILIFFSSDVLKIIYGYYALRRHLFEQSESVFRAFDFCFSDFGNLYRQSEMQCGPPYIWKTQLAGLSRLLEIDEYGFIHLGKRVNFSKDAWRTKREYVGNLHQAFLFLPQATRYNLTEVFQGKCVDPIQKQKPCLSWSSLPRQNWLFDNFFLCYAAKYLFPTAPVNGGTQILIKHLFFQHYTKTSLTCVGETASSAFFFCEWSTTKAVKMLFALQMQELIPYFSSLSSKNVAHELQSLFGESSK